VKIGALTSLTATFAPWGVSALDGMRLAVEEINAAGGAGGYTLVLVEADTQSNAEEAVKAFERMVEDGVVAIGGPISSDVGLNTAIVAEELQVPLFLVKAGSGAILTRDSRYTFRTCLPAAPMTMGPIAQYAQEQGVSRVGAIIADYGWGRAIEAALLDTFAGLPDIDLQIEVAPIGEKDFTTYLRSLAEFDPQLIVATGHPPGAGAITVQSADLGFDVPITGAWFPLSLIMGGGAAEPAVGRFADFGCADYDSQSYQDLAKRYLAFSDNVFMEDDAVAGYGIVTMVADAIANVGPDPVAIAEYLHSQSYDLPGYAFEMAWTEWGELAKAQPTFVIMRDSGAPEGVNDSGDWWPELLVRSEPLEPFEP
jgi:branched-chain amino acid transport system substrate-binding protein